MVQVSDSTDDATLAMQIRKGCEQSWTILYRRFQGRIYRFGWRMSGSSALAEEATQETFLALLRNPDRYDPGRGSLVSFLLAVARRKVLDLLEKERAYLEMPGGMGEIADAEEGVDCMGQSAMLRSVLGLPAQYREVIVLIELEEMDYAEAAAALDCPVGTVRSRLHRGRQMLMERMVPVCRT
jgi:RNA polymerase sigma-70 factor (ECF subfamily)